MAAIRFESIFEAFDPNKQSPKVFHALMDQIPLEELLQPVYRLSAKLGRNAFHHLAVCDRGHLIPKKYRTLELFQIQDGLGDTLFHAMVRKNSTSIPRHLRTLENFKFADAKGETLLETIHHWSRQQTLLPPYCDEAAAEMSPAERQAWLDALTPYKTPPIVLARLMNHVEPTGAWRKL